MTIAQAQTLAVIFGTTPADLLGLKTPRDDGAGNLMAIWDRLPQDRRRELLTFATDLLMRAS